MVPVKVIINGVAKYLNSFSTCRLRKSGDLYFEEAS